MVQPPQLSLCASMRFANFKLHSSEVTKESVTGMDARFCKETILARVLPPSHLVIIHVHPCGVVIDSFGSIGCRVIVQPVR